MLPQVVGRCNIHSAKITACKTSDLKVEEAYPAAQYVLTYVLAFISAVIIYCSKHE